MTLQYEPNSLALDSATVNQMFKDHGSTVWYKTQGPITALTPTSWVGTSGMETGKGASIIYYNHSFSLEHALALPHMRALLY